MSTGLRYPLLAGPRAIDMPLSVLLRARSNRKRHVDEFQGQRGAGEGAADPAPKRRARAGHGTEAPPTGAVTGAVTGGADRSGDRVARSDRSGHIVTRGHRVSVRHVAHPGATTTGDSFDKVPTVAPLAMLSVALLTLWRLVALNSLVVAELIVERLIPKFEL